LQELNAEKDLVKQTEIRRAYQRSELNRGYSLYAEKALNPKAAEARKYLSMIEG
jgi:hypothetical protein